MCFFPRADTVKEAHELACRAAFTTWLSMDAGRVVLRPTSWNCSEEAIVQHFAQVQGTAAHQPLAVPVPHARRSMYQPPGAGEEAEREQRIHVKMRMGRVILPGSSGCQMEGNHGRNWIAS